MAACSSHCTIIRRHTRSRTRSRSAMPARSVSPLNPHAFFLCTDEEDFRKLATSPYNVVLQKKAPPADDGSLSRLAAARGVRYVNSEVAKGHSSRQKEMLEILGSSGIYRSTRVCRSRDHDGNVRLLSRSRTRAARLPYVGKGFEAATVRKPLAGPLSASCDIVGADRMRNEFIRQKNRRLIRARGRLPGE